MRGAVVVWVALVVAMTVPALLATASPYLAYRDLPYLIGGFAGIVCLSLFALQPLLAAGYLPGVRLSTARRWHRRIGSAIVAFVVLHVGGLYVASPPDVLDALMLVSPTAFSVYGVIAMWGALATGVLAVPRLRLRWRYATWAGVHNALALVVVAATVVHALKIEGAMEPASKWAICIAALATSIVGILDVRLRGRPAHLGGGAQAKAGDRPR